MGARRDVPQGPVLQSPHGIRSQVHQTRCEAGLPGSCREDERFARLFLLRRRRRIARVLCLKANYCDSMCSGLHWREGGGVAECEGDAPHKKTCPRKHT